MNPKVSPLQAMKTTGDVAAKSHTFAATTLEEIVGSQRTAFFNPKKIPELILYEAEWVQGSV